MNAAGGAPVPGELRHVADVVQEWGVPRGWRVARDVHKRVLGQFPGTPFHAFRRKRVPVVATGSVDGAPAALVQVDFVVKSEEHVRPVINPDRVQWLYNKNAGPYPGVRLEQTNFRLTGRSLVVWVHRPIFEPAVLDGLVATAQEIRRWITHESCQSGAAESALRVSGLQLPVP